MALPTSYLTSVKNLGAILEAIKSAQAPSKFTVKILLGLGFTSTADRLVIAIMKSLGFLSSEAANPTERYYSFLDQSQSSVVLSEGISEAYRDLFQVNKEAQLFKSIKKLRIWQKSEVENKFKTLTEGKYSKSVIGKMATTFTSLCKLADFKTKPAQTTADLAARAPKEQDNELMKTVDDPEHEFAPGRIRTIGGLHYNIQIILPESRDPRVYDVLFRSLNRHLLRDTD